ncbi:MAG: fibronectin type III domain-containing protein [bacterium]|nr:fibronectin type III domain-containing protein [bacterium]
MKNGRKLFRRIPRFGRLNLGCAIIVMVICTALVPAAASSPVVAQEQTSWYVNDDPSLFGPSEYWYWGDPGHGYGSNYYRYTYAIGGARSADNWARWSMGPRVGLQEIQVYVPSNHATATVYYNITIGSRTFRRSVAQASISGWHSLGNWDAGGADVVVAVYDNDAGHHKDRHGFAASRIGVDAIRMRCVARCSANPSPPSPPPPQRDVTIELGADRSGCGYSHLPCRWVDATFEGFASGRYLLECYWSTSRGSLGSRTASRTITVSGRSVDELCWFNVQPGRYLTLVVDGVRSNTIQFSGTTSPPPPPPPPSSLVVEVPSAPSFLAASVGERRAGVLWSPPADDGGAPVTRYRVELYEGGTRVDRFYVASGAVEVSFGGLTPGTAYTAYVRAENRAGWGARDSTTFTTLADSSPPPTTTTTTQPPEAQATRAIRISLGADRSGCGYEHLPCRWVDATFDRFASGRYLLECYWSTSRGSLGNRTASRTITVSSRSVDNLCWFNVQPGRHLTMVVDGVQSNTIQFAGTLGQTSASQNNDQNNNDLPPSMADVDAGLATALPAPSEATAPSSPRNLEIAVIDSNRDADTLKDDLIVTWDSPDNNGGARVAGYRMTISRPPISNGPDVRPHPWSTSGRPSSPYEFAGLSCAAYTITLAAENRAGRGSISRATVSTECPPRPGYLNDDPVIRGGEASGLGQGTMAGWVIYKLGVFTANTYFPDEDNPNNPKPGDHIGTNGFHVVHIGDRNHYAYWTFRDVDPGRYDVQVFVPAHRDCTATAGTALGEVVEFVGGIFGSDYEAVCNYRFRPGVNAEYRVYEDVLVDADGDTTFRGLQFHTTVDQSLKSSDTGRWVTLGSLDVASAMNPTVRVATFDLDHVGDRDYPHSTTSTGDERWEHHLAVDAARLIPVDAVVDWSSDQRYVDAVAWCQSDVIYQLVIDPIVDLILEHTLGTIKDTMIESAITGALVGAAAGLTAASGGIGTPLLVGTVGVKIASGAKFVVKVVTKVQKIWDLFRRLDEILDKIRRVRDTAEVFAEVLDNFVLDNFKLSATGEDGLDHEFDLGSMCEQDAVWENYYGDNNFGGEVQKFVRERFEEAARLVG